MMEGTEPPTEGTLEKVATMLTRLMDKTTIWVKTRWVLLAVLMLTFAVRIYLVEGFYIVTYGLGIYVLNLLIGFLSPAVDPEEDAGLPTKEREEFRPFSRKLPEFKFWRSAFYAVLTSIVMTFFSVFDLPVFWPILLAYFVLLVCLTLKDRIRHMIKHNYVPISFGKQTYGELTKVKAGANAEKGDSKDSK
mmetsp:Transcript_32113/g.81479  ORF Transcript_32113/g.81479 Transcript_32113/m.81479 type:complete len:191 (-) Transcript_32113:152-724(-)